MKKKDVVVQIKEDRRVNGREDRAGLHLQLQLHGSLLLGGPQNCVALCSAPSAFGLQGFSWGSHLEASFLSQYLPVSSLDQHSTA